MRVKRSQPLTLEFVLNGKPVEYTPDFELAIPYIKVVVETKPREFLLKDPALAKYGPWLRDLRVFRPHQLSDELEKALHEKYVVGRAAWSRLFDETIARLREHALEDGIRQNSVKPAKDLLAGLEEGLVLELDRRNASSGSAA